MISTKQKAIITNVVQPYSPVMLAVFGSYARNEQHACSDIDLLIDFKSTVHLLDLIGLEQELEEKLGVKVDLVTLQSLDPKLKHYIEKDAVRIL